MSMVTTNNEVQAQDTNRNGVTNTRSSTPISTSGSVSSTKPIPPQRSESNFKISAPVPPHVHLSSFYEQILTSKSIYRFPELKESVQRAFDMIKSEGFSKERAQLPHNVDVVLQPLISACQSGSQTLTLIGLDGLSKLISYDYLSNQAVLTSPLTTINSATKERSPIERAVLAICGCFKGDVTEEKVQTQIIKGLMAAVSSESTLIHQEALLNAIRTLYNIFLLSRNLSNQIIAQSTLIQMSRSVFSRIQTDADEASANKAKKPTSIRTTSFSSKSNRYDDSDDDEVTIKEDVNVEDEKLSLEAIGGKAAEAAANAQVQGNICDVTSDLNALDGFLLFRALCKLSVKPIQNEATIDVRSMSLRSKLLALYLILLILTEFPEVFIKSKVHFLVPNGLDDTRQVRVASFLTAVKPYFGLSLSRNLVSTLPKVFELSLAIFDSVVRNLRGPLKAEIEVFIKEIIVPILEAKKHGNQQKKHVLMALFLSKITTNPQILVDFYLNYDCDRGNLNNNVFESLASALSKLTTSVIIQELEDMPTLIWEEPDCIPITLKGDMVKDLINLSPLTSDRFSNSYISNSFFSRATFTESILQQRSLECLNNILKSLVIWSKKGQQGTTTETTNDDTTTLNSTNEDAISEFGGSNSSPDDNVLPCLDDPTQFQQHKMEKQNLIKGVDKFNRKPRAGLEFLIQNNLLEPESPQAIAHFLLTTSTLDKHQIGEFLGENEQLSLQVLHHFVEMIDFKDLEFVNAMRLYLKAFRLPGEAQKIDRFMLKFAERYHSQNPTVFKEADTAYVLAYSTIMLNTDLYNPQVKKRMTKADFIKNNAGIDGGNDLDQSFLNEIYDQLSFKEIKLKDDLDEIAKEETVSGSLASQFDLLGSGKKRDEDLKLSLMQSNAEKYLKKMLAHSAKWTSDPTNFTSGRHAEHVKPMFEVSWMPILAALSDPLKHSLSSRVIALCLDSFRAAVHIAGYFDLELARNAFITALGNFCFLTDLTQMQPKNLEAIRTLLEMAVEDGNYLKGTWNEILSIVNHLVKVQLVPNFTATSNGRDRSLVAHRDPSSRRLAKIALVESNSQSLLIAVDKVFAYSVYLNGDAIVQFVESLASIATEELNDLPRVFDRTKAQASPRMFALQKLVEVAYYNMNRIRLEWKGIWSVLGSTFTVLGCHNNEAVASFIVESLRQLSTKYLDKDELAHFKFQESFLTPFKVIVQRSPNDNIKSMVVQTLGQLLKTHSNSLMSGMRTVLEALAQACHSTNEELVIQAFEHVKRLANDRFDLLILNPDNLVATLDCLSQFAKHKTLQKVALQAVEVFKLTCDRTIEHFTLNEELSTTTSFGTLDNLDFPELSFWIPIFKGLMDMVRQVIDLEVRTRAMDQLFKYLDNFGRQFPPQFWAHLLTNILFPLFAALGKKDGLQLQFQTSEDAAVWLSTTLVHALDKFINLFTANFDLVAAYIDGLLDLLAVCLCQENTTLVKVGADCFQRLVESNLHKLEEKDWNRILSIVIRLFQASSQVSTQHLEGLTINNRGKTLELLASIVNQDDVMDPLPVIPATPALRLNLCLTTIRLVEDIFLQNDLVFNRIQPDHIFVLLDLIERAYLETKHSNQDFDLVQAIERQSVNRLEKFAATSLALELNCSVALIKVLLKMFNSTDATFLPFRNEIEDRLVPLCKDTFTEFNKLSEYPLVPGIDNIFKLRLQVTLRVGNFLTKADTQQFQKIFTPISKQVVATLRHKHLDLSLREVMCNLMERVDTVYIHHELELDSSQETQVPLPADEEEVIVVKEVNQPLDEQVDAQLPTTQEQQVNDDEEEEKFLDANPSPTLIANTLVNYDDFN